MSKKIYPCKILYINKLQQKKKNQRNTSNFIILDFGNKFVLLPKSNYLCTELLLIVE